MYLYIMVGKLLEIKILRKYRVNVNVDGTVEESGTKYGRALWAEQPPKPLYGKIRTVDGWNQTIPPKHRREKGEALEIAERVLAKLFKRRILVPAKEAIEALSDALGVQKPTKHLRGTTGQIYNLRDRLGYGSIRNIDTGQKFWATEEVIEALLNGEN